MPGGASEPRQQAGKAWDGRREILGGQRRTQMCYILYYIRYDIYWITDILYCVLYVIYIYHISYVIYYILYVVYCTLS